MDIKLYIDVQDSEVLLMMSNQIASEPTEHALTGGFCLRICNCELRVMRTNEIRFHWHTVDY